MKNIKYLLLTITILFISACEGPEYYTFQGSSEDTGPFTAPMQPTQYTECELVPQFSFEKDEAMEIVIKCEEDVNY